MCCESTSNSQAKNWLRASEQKEKLMTYETDEKLTVQAELRVNGKAIKLNNFVQNFISQTVFGMVKSLQDVGDIETVDLKISRLAK